MDWSKFFVLHADLPREGPGEAADVAWALSVGNVPSDARICDAACGPGADIAALLKAGPKARVEGVEKQTHFVADAQAAFSDEPRVSIRQGDMGQLSGPYDLIWCAGALYFLGVSEGLTTWRSALAADGVVAFSEPCWFSETRSALAQKNWADYDAMTDAAGIDARVRAAGFETIATRRVTDAGWEAYYTPMEDRIAKLRPDADAGLHEILDEGDAEMAAWRAHRDEFGYLISVVRPL